MSERADAFSVARRNEQETLSDLALRCIEAVRDCADLESWRIRAFASRLCLWNVVSGVPANIRPKSECPARSASVRPRRHQPRGSRRIGECVGRCLRARPYGLIRIDATSPTARIAPHALSALRRATRLARSTRLDRTRVNRRRGGFRGFVAARGACASQFITRNRNRRCP